MILTIELPPVDKRLDVNHGKRNGLARASAVKKTRSMGRILALEAMQRVGLSRGQMRPRFVWLVTNWRGHRVDYDNRLANIKAFQDGIFDALGANDNEVVAGCSSVRHLPKEHADRHLTMRLMLFEYLGEFLGALRSLDVDADVEPVRKGDSFLPGFAGGVVGDTIRRGNA